MHVRVSRNKNTSRNSIHDFPKFDTICSRYINIQKQYIHIGKILFSERLICRFKTSQNSSWGWAFTKETVMSKSISLSSIIKDRKGFTESVLVKIQKNEIIRLLNRLFVYCSL